MFALSPATRIYLAAGSTDLRKGFDGLTALAQSIWAADPLSGHLFLYTNRQRNRLKMIWWDGSGLWCCTKRLEKGRFSWPETTDGAAITLDAQELALLVGGIDMAKTRRKDWWRKPLLSG
jgi:transposase